MRIADIRGGSSIGTGLKRQLDDGNFKRFRWLFVNFRDNVSVIIRDTQSLVGFSVIPKFLTFNDL